MKKKPAILMICINFSPELTGIGRYTGDMAQWLLAEDADLQVVTGFPYYPDWKIKDGYRSGWFSNDLMGDIPALRCPLYVPKKPSAFRRILQDFSFFLSSWMAVSFLLLKGKKYDHVWVAMPSFLTALVGQWYCYWRPKSKLHLHIFDLQIDAARSLGMIRSPWLLRILTDIEQFSLRRADRVSCLTEGMQAKLKKKGVESSRLSLLPIWVDTNRFRPQSIDAAILSRQAIPVDKKMILYSGAIGEKQGLDRVVEMAAMAESKNLALVFVIAGAGPYLDKLKQDAAQGGPSNLLFIPLQPDDVFPAMLNAAWLHLILQKDTGSDNFLPSKLMPVLSVGGLAIVTAGADTSLGRMITAHGIGYLSPGNHPQEILELIHRLSNHPDETRMIKMHARKYAEDHCSRDRLLSEYWSGLLKSGADKLNNEIV